MAKYSCKCCGAELFFDPKLGKLHCDYCDSSFDVSEYAGAAKEFGGAAKKVEYGDGEPVTEPSTDDSTGELVVYQCPHCGAEVITAKSTAATTCVYCNRAITLEGNLTGDFAPQVVLPFEKDRKDVEAAYTELCKKSVLTPRLFRQQSTIEKIKGMFVPFWLYSFDGEIDMQVHGENSRTFRSGDDEITEISTYEVMESGKAAFKDIPADGLKDMDDAIMDSIEPFSFDKLQPFNPAYLAGFYTQRWTSSAQENEHRALTRAENAITDAAYSAAGAFDHSKSVLGKDVRFGNKKVTYAMLPVWMMYTEYKGKKYLFGMNGQTGKIIGKIPKDPGRIGKIAAGVFVGSQLIMMLLRVLGVM